MSHGWEQWIGQLIDGTFYSSTSRLEYVGVFLAERQERGEVQQVAIKLIQLLPTAAST